MAGPGRVRFVTHLDMDDGDIDAAIAAVRATMVDLGKEPSRLLPRPLQGGGNHQTCLLLDGIRCRAP